MTDEKPQKCDWHYIDGGWNTFCGYRSLELDDYWVWCPYCRDAIDDLYYTIRDDWQSGTRRQRARGVAAYNDLVAKRHA